MTYNDMDNHNTKISYENFTTAMPSTLPIGVIWIIIQMIFLTTLTFVMMCIIAYISRVKLVRDIYAIKV